jgi:hypothetical protein
MKPEFKPGLTPYTDAERERDAAERRERDRRQLIRKRATPRGPYNVPGTPQSREFDLRKIGESA